MSDDAYRRQLRFSVFLQAAACLMLAIACGVRVATNGIDALAVGLGIAALVAGTAAAIIVRKLRA